MKVSILSTLVGLALAAPAPSLADSLTSRMTDSYIRRGVRKGFGYSEATLYAGVEAAYALAPNTTVLEWYRGQIDAVVRPDGSIVNWNTARHSLDDYRIGNNLLWWYSHTNDTKYATAAATIRRQLNAHPRTPSGGFWHREPVYPNQMWLDGIFMADNFYARWTRLMDAGNATAWDDVVLQYDLIEEHTRNHTSNLLAHGYDESKVAVWADPETGASPLVWSRAVGWYFMSLVGVLEDFPEEHAGYERLLGYFTSLAAGLQASIDDGAWWLIMNEPYPGKPRNYLESSASAMFTYGLLKGLRKGYLPETYRATAEQAYATLVERWVTENADGTLNWEGTVEVGSLSSNASYEYYVSVPVVINDDRGGGSFILAASEAEM